MHCMPTQVKHSLLTNLAVLFIVLPAVCSKTNTVPWFIWHLQVTLRFMK